MMDFKAGTPSPPSPSRPTALIAPNNNHHHHHLVDNPMQNNKRPKKKQKKRRRLDGGGHDDNHLSSGSGSSSAGSSSSASEDNFSDEEDDLGLDSTEESDLKSARRPPLVNKAKKTNASKPIRPAKTTVVKLVEDDSTTLKEPLYEEDIVDGFSFVAFKTYEDLELMAKWSDSHNGKFPDPYAKLKLEEETPKKKRRKKKLRDKIQKVQNNNKANNPDSNSANNSQQHQHQQHQVGVDANGNKGAENAVGDLFSVGRKGSSQANGVGPSFGEPSSASGSSGPSTLSSSDAAASAPTASPSSSSAPSQASSSSKKGLYRPYATSPPANSNSTSASNSVQQQHPAYRAHDSTTVPATNPDPYAFSVNPYFPLSSLYGSKLSSVPGGAPLATSSVPSSTTSSHLAAQLGHLPSTSANRLAYLSGLGQELYPGASSSPLLAHSTWPTSKPNDKIPSTTTLANSLSATTTSSSSSVTPAAKGDLLRKELEPKFGPDPSGRPATAGPLGAQNTAYLRQGPDMQKGPMPPTVTGPASFLSNPLMKDVPKLGGANSLFYPGLPGLGPPPPPPPGAAPHLRVPFPSPSIQRPMTPKKTGKWNAMHVRIAWEIYNHQQKQKPEKSSASITSSSGSTTTVTSGSSLSTQASSTPSGTLSISASTSLSTSTSASTASKSSSLKPGGILPPPPGGIAIPPGLPPSMGAPPGSLGMDLFSSTLYPRSGTDLLNPFGLHRPPFPTSLYGGNPLDPLASFPRYGVPPSTTIGSAAASFGGLGSLRNSILPPSDPFSSLVSRPGTVLPPSTSTTALPSPSSPWPLKAESSLLSPHEKQRRQILEEKQRQLQQQQQQKQKQKERDRKERESKSLMGIRNGSPSLIGQERSRSPLRTNSASGGIPVPPPQRRSSTNDLNNQSPAGLVKHQALDMSNHSNNSNSSQDNEITVISEKEGNTTIAHNGRPMSRQSPQVGSRPLSRTAAVSRPSSNPQKNSNPVSTAAYSHHLTSRSLPFSSAAAAALMTPTSLYGFPGMPPGLPPPGIDPRSSLYQGLFPPPPPGLPPTSLFDPLMRDPYRAVLSMYSKDPLREARERELLRMNPLGSMIMSEQDRARMAALGAAYPPPPPPSATPTPTPGGLFPPPPPPPHSFGVGAKPPTAPAHGMYPTPPGFGTQPRLTPPLTPTLNGHGGSASGSPALKDLMPPR